MTEWKGDEGFLVHLRQLLQHSARNMGGGGGGVNISQKLDEYRQLGDFECYLANCFATNDINILGNEGKALAGLLLKNEISRKGRQGETILNSAFIQQRVLIVLSCPGNSHLLQSTAGTIISTWVQFYTLQSWPDLLSHICSLIEHHYGQQEKAALMTAKNALSTLCKLAEDAIGSFETAEASGSLDFVMNKLVFYIRSVPLSLCVEAMRGLNEFLPHVSPKQMHGQVASLLAVLSERATEAMSHGDANQSDTLQTVCRLLVTLLTYYGDAMEASLASIMEFTLQLLGQEDTLIALEACEFWRVLGERLDEQASMGVAIEYEKSLRLFNGVVRPILPRLIPLLLKKMIYEEDDPIFIAFAQDTAATSTSVPDAESDVKPQHYHEGKEEGEINADECDEDEESTAEDDDSMEDDYEWNLRKCAASCLDLFSLWFDDAIMEHILFPLLTQALNLDTKQPVNSKVPGVDWRVKEVAILALGAISQHCMNALRPYLLTLMPLLCRLCANDMQWPLIRSITAWTLSRLAISFSAKHGTTNNATEEELVPLSNTQGECLCEIASTLLILFLDRNKRVQGAALSAIACYLEDAPHLLMLNPTLPHSQTFFISALIQTWHQLVPQVQSKNKLALLDCISTFANCLSPFLVLKMSNDNPLLLNDTKLFLSDVFSLVNDTSEFSSHIFPVLKSLEHVLLTFKPLFAKEPSLLIFIEKAFNFAWTFTTESLTLPDASEEALELEDLCLASLHLLQIVLLVTSDLQPIMESLLVREKDPDWQQLFQRALSQGISPSIRQATLKLLKELMNKHPTFVLKYKAFFAAM